MNPAEAKEFAVRIRLPHHDVSDLYSGEPVSDGITLIRVNGESVDPPEENGYAVIERTWKAGDRIQLTLPMKLQRVTGIDKIEATRSQVALRHGPLIYCVESVDQEDIDKQLPHEASLKTEWREDLLGGMQVITGKWADGSPFLAIPYYARQNRRGDGAGNRRGVRSSVWIDEE